MSTLSNHPRFLEDFERLAKVRLNPARHEAPDAATHARWVSARAQELGRENSLDAADVDRLGDLGLVHDIGKITGTANPSRSVDLLPRYDLVEPGFVELVANHDINLPLYRAKERGEGPSDKAWRRLAARVDLRMLCLFMVADRVDFPGGFDKNAPLVWFLGEARRRGLVGELELGIDEERTVARRAGAAVVRVAARGRELLVLSLGEGLLVLPKGHVEDDEDDERAARRALVEETGARVAPTPGVLLGELRSELVHDLALTRERVAYFRLELAGEPASLRERARWIDATEVERAAWVSEDLRALARRALLAQP